MESWRSLISDAAEHAQRGNNAGLAATITALGAAVREAATADLVELAAVGAVHELPWVRLAVLLALADRAPDHTEVRLLIAWLTHDYEDFIAFEAIGLAARLRMPEVLSELLVIVGRASRRLHGNAGKPVGIGHAVVLNAITAIVGSDDADRLGRIEQELFPDGVDSRTYPLLPPRDATSVGEHRHGGMVRVAGGEVKGGPPPSFDRSKLVFDWNDPPGVRQCGDFWMDVLPVSNAEYDVFAYSEQARRHTYCHPAEPEGKLHIRNTVLDARSGPEHPATGVDWFDAYAYARSQNKRLPDETEWQRAAQGNDQRAYPWGNTFEANRTHCLTGPMGHGWDGVLEWRDELLKLAGTPPLTTTVPRGIPGSESPAGVSDLSGNVWEWTSSSFQGQRFSPEDAGRDPIDVIYDTRSYVVIKGGTWSSLPEQASVAFRGRDLALDRHFEIGFRCVCNCRP